MYDLSSDLYVSNATGYALRSEGVLSVSDHASFPEDSFKSSLTIELKSI